MPAITEEDLKTADTVNKLVFLGRIQDIKARPRMFFRNNRDAFGLLVGMSMMIDESRGLRACFENAPNVTRGSGYNTIFMDADLNESWLNDLLDSLTKVLTAE
jgi:hypothetical protein